MNVTHSKFCNQKINIILPSYEKSPLLIVANSSSIKYTKTTINQSIRYYICRVLLLISSNLYFQFSYIKKPTKLFLLLKNKIGVTYNEIYGI